MPDEAPAPHAPSLPDVPPAAPAAAPPGHDGGGTQPPAGEVGDLPRIEAAAAVAIDSHLSEKRGRGKRGPDKKPRRPRLPLGQMGNGSAPPPVAPGAPTPLAVEWAEPPPVDREFLQAGAELSTDIANDIAQTGMELYALKHLGDATAAAEAGKKARMKEAREQRIRAAVLRWAERNPEKATGFFAGLAFFDPGAWFLELGRQAQAIREAGKALRENPKSP